MINFNDYSENNYIFIYLNYEKEKGIEIFEDLFEFKSYYEKNNEFYKIYIFNEKGMDTYINIDDDIIKYSSFDDINCKLYEKYFYLENCDYSKIKITYYLDKKNKTKFYYSGLVK